MLIVLLLLTALGLGANPISPAYIQQLWFNDAGDLIVQFGYFASYLAEFEIELTFSDGTNSSLFELTETEQDNYPLEYNLSIVAPNLNFNPQSGYFSMSIPYQQEELRWGNTWNCQVSPLQGTQTYYQYLEFDTNGWETITYYYWAKSSSAQDVIDYHCTPASNLEINLQNMQNEPLIGFRVFYDNLLFPIGLSDENGVFACPTPSRRTTFHICPPASTGNTDVLYEAAAFIAEPGESYSYNIVLDYTSTDDPVNPVPAVKMSLKPSVVHAGQMLKVDSGESFSGAAWLEMYDLKGRLLHTYEYHGSLEFTPEKLPAGIYFLRLMDRGRVLDTQRFIILK